MSSSAPEQLFADALQAGYAALARGQWAAGRGCFEAALAQAETPEAYEALGYAAYWQDDAAMLFDSRERAYRLYRARGDRRGAGRMACLLADASLLFRNQEAISNGWLQRAHRLLDGLEPALEHGMLAAFEGFHALQFRHDIAAARRCGAEARLALDVFQRLGAAPDAARATELLEQLGAAAADPLPLPATLTRREAEVLGLLASGLSNQAIASALYLSVRTVERHISTIYAKLGAEGPTARMAASAFAVTHGLAASVPP